MESDNYVRSEQFDDFPGFFILIGYYVCRRTVLITEQRLS